MFPPDLEPDRFAGERWAVDEIFDGMVRILAAASKDPTPFAQMAYLEGHASEQGPEAAALAHQLLVDIEAAEAEITWDDEVDVVMPVEDFERLISKRREALDLPGSRRLSEGDVFWVAVARSAFELADTPFPRIADPDAIARFAASDPLVDALGLWVRVAQLYEYTSDMWDATLAARGVIDADYEHALQGAALEILHG